MFNFLGLGMMRVTGKYQILTQRLTMLCKAAPSDVPLTHEVFGRFRLDEVETTYTISTATSGSGKRAGELIVRNG